jgi:Sugar (and other) transporter
MQVPESPRWLLTQGNQELALKILREASATNGHDSMATFPEGTVLIDMQHSEEVSFSDLFHPEWRRMTVLLWGLWVGLAFLYWGTM